MKSFAFIICMAVPLMLALSGCSGVKELHSAMNDAAAVGEISTSGLQIVRNKTTKSEVFKAIGAPGLVLSACRGPAE